METLLHFIAKLVHGEGEASLATIETFYTEWVSVWDAKNVTCPSSSFPLTPPPQISSKQLESEFKDLETSVKEAKKGVTSSHTPLPPASLL
jgi:hypothetical protein